MLQTRCEITKPRYCSMPRLPSQTAVVSGSAEAGHLGFSRAWHYAFAVATPVSTQALDRHYGILEALSLIHI